ncbi:unnamed protein product [Chondrus crispus]|uniref:SURF1-like protein n=1 Tax=Chondrus crispus TaxID=2769 RepID=R7Q3N1_CHOCR|nr:unnamed protein product [Chondrus crispus]CDF33137.1 unnamed protein product [Chondrus crispus]|eukprot:XP_005712940.1 unnamed protein product [Chondrus crispus]
MWASLRSKAVACNLRRCLTTSNPTPKRSPSRETPQATGGKQRAHQTGFSPQAALFFGVPIAVTFSLGVWQVRRLNRKIRLIKERENHLSAPPLAAADLFTASSDLDHRRVQVSGRFLHDAEITVGPRSAPKDLPSPVLQWGGSSGLQIITPMEMEDGKVILVNRGWVPQRLAQAPKRRHAVVSPHPFLTRVDSSTPTCDYEDGATGKSSLKTFTAVVRGCDEKNRFTPDNQPAKGEWYYIDPDAILHAHELCDGDTRAVVVELLEPLPRGGWPHPRSYNDLLEFRTPPSTHVTYATTWFCLSAALALLTRNRFRQRGRGRT